MVVPIAHSQTRQRTRHDLLLAEAFGMAVAGGVDSRIVYEVMRNSSASCRSLDDWGISILEGNFDPARNATLDIIAKDIRLATNLGREQGFPMVHAVRNL